jgi:hypothetical protein
MVASRRGTLRSSPAEYALGLGGGIVPSLLGIALLICGGYLVQRETAKPGDVRGGAESKALLGVGIAMLVAGALLFGWLFLV